jgi:hypothetical protein
VALTVTGDNIPEIIIRIESDVLDCTVRANFRFPRSPMLKSLKISEPGDYAPFYVIVMKVSLHRPLSNECLAFWSKQANSEPNQLFVFGH